MPVVVDVRELDGLPEILGPRRLLERCERRLAEEGQIDPLLLSSSMELLANWYDAYYLQAARNLGWSTVLVTWPGEGRLYRTTS